MSPNTDHVGTVDTIERSSIDNKVTMKEAIAASGLTAEQAVIVVNPYEVINQNKDVLLSRTFFIRKIVFSTDETSGVEYSVTYLVTDEDKLYVMTDGSTGIYTQLRKIVEEYGRDHDFLILNGLRKSDFAVLDGKSVKTGTPGSTPAATYYLA